MDGATDEVREASRVRAIPLLQGVGTAWAPALFVVRPRLKITDLQRVIRWAVCKPRATST
jgi:hypothetical protein